MRVTIFFLSVVIFYTIPVQAQAPDTLWTKTYGGPDRDEGISVQQTFDGGFIIAGSSVDFGAGLRNVYLVKTDASGSTLWTQTYGGIGDHFGNCVRQTSDSGYIITGATGDLSQITDVYLVRTDANGDTLWTRKYGGVEYDEGICVQETFDGGFITVGLTKSFGAGIADVYLIKTKANGETDWSRTYGEQLWEEGRSVQQTSDSGFIVVGYKTITSSPSGPDSDVYLIKTDANGDTLWTRLYGVQAGEYRDEGWSVQQTTDGGYIISGETWYPGTPAWEIDVYLIKTDASGDIMWTKTYDNSESTDVGRFVQQTSDGGYIIAGYSHIIATNYDVYLIKTDANGDTLWTKTIGGQIQTVPWDEGWAVDQTEGGGYIVVGWTWSFGAGDRDIYLIRLAPDPTQIEIKPGDQFPQSFVLYQNYPNPFNPSTTIKYSIPKSGYVHLKIFNALGEEVANIVNEYQQAGIYKVNFNALNLPAGRQGLSSGVYYYRLESGRFSQAHKMILLR